MQAWLPSRRLASAFTAVTVGCSTYLHPQTFLLPSSILLICAYIPPSLPPLCQSACISLRECFNSGRRCPLVQAVPAATHQDQDVQDQDELKPTCGRAGLRVLRSRAGGGTEEREDGRGGGERVMESGRPSSS